MSDFEKGKRPNRPEKTLEYTLIAGTDPEERVRYYCSECKAPVDSTKLEVHAQYIHRAPMMRVITRPMMHMEAVKTND